AVTRGGGDHKGDIAALGPATSPPPERRPTAVNANDATLTELATAQSGSMVADNTPNAPAGGSFDLVVGAVAGGALGSSGAPYTLPISAIDLTAVSQPRPPPTPPHALHPASGRQPRRPRPHHPLTPTL